MYEKSGDTTNVNVFQENRNKTQIKKRKKNAHTHIQQHEQANELKNDENGISQKNV